LALLGDHGPGEYAGDDSAAQAMAARGTAGGGRLMTGPNMEGGKRRADAFLKKWRLTLRRYGDTLAVDKKSLFEILIRRFARIVPPLR
jgi:hypothetical protein